MENCNEFPSNANKTFVGFSKDVACSSLGSDILVVKVRLRSALFIDEYFGAYEFIDAIGAMHTFQDLTEITLLPISIQCTTVILTEIKL